MDGWGDVPLHIIASHVDFSMDTYMSLLRGNVCHVVGTYMT